MSVSSGPLPDAEVEWRRHPSDVARLVLSGAALVLALATAANFPGALSNLSADLVVLVGRLPASVRALLIGLAQLTVIVLPIVLVVWAARWRRGRELAVVVASGLLGIGVMALLVDWLDRVAPPELLDAEPAASWVGDSSFPSISYVAGLAAVVTVLVPVIDARWSRLAWSSLGIAMLVTAMTATRVPVNVGIAAVLGVVVGSAVLVAAGAPVRRPGSDRLAAAIDGLGLELDGEVGDAPGPDRAWLARTTEGATVRLVYVGADERDANLLYRVWRGLRVKGIEDESPGVTPRRLARNEALVTLLAAQRGVSVPPVLGVDQGTDSSAVLAFDWCDGPTLASSASDGLDDAVLVDTWRQVQRLHAAGLAHRRLAADRVLVTAGGVRLTGLRWGRVDATGAQQATDVAELLVSTALLVGPERAVAAAAAVDPDALVAAQGYVQPLALSHATRRAAKEADGLLDAVRAEVQRTTGAEEPELEQLARITLAGAAAGVGLFVLVGFALGLAANFGDIVDAMSGADWTYVPLILAITIVTYVGGALSLTGSVVRPISLTQSTAVMFGQSFLNRFTPANAGGMAMRVRFLQKGGTELSVAAAAIGLTSAASGVVQVLLVVVFFTWSGSTPGGGDTFSVDGQAVAFGVLLVVGVLSALWAIPLLRRTIGRRLRAASERLTAEYGELVRQPSKLVRLFGGAALSKLSYIVAFGWSCRAFGIDLGFAEIGALYLTSTTVASAVPSPGGVGAIEAALVFVLTGAGVDDAEAWSAVLLFRLITYWLPTLPGWIALKYSERAELV
ncbi:MAG: flippase-like domain-containing protein [Actinomycetota bacterium]